MSPAPKHKETRISLPVAVHEAARKMAGGSLRAWIAALVAREVGMSKAYEAPSWGGERQPKD